MKREEIKSILDKHNDNPKTAYSILLFADGIENGIKTILKSDEPHMSVEKTLAIIRSIIDNNKQFYYSTSGVVPKDAEYVCDIGECDAGALYVK